MLKTIIIGQGMAGSVLAWELHRRGHAVMIVDDGHRSSASRVAAGMVNPVQGQRLNLAWRIEDCLPVAKRFFRAVEQQFGRPFFQPSPILRLLDNDKEMEFLAKRREDSRFATFLGPTQAPASHPGLSDERGSVVINHSGYVETNPLLDALRDYFAAENILCNTEFKHDDLSVTKDAVTWRELEAQQIIFAEGWRILENPWFSEFNFQPNKGEILTIAADREFPTHPINRGKWMIPQSDGTIWAGSTYGRGQTDSEVTDAGREEILSKVAATLPTHQLTVTSQRAGVRCATGDHVPRAGFHPQHPRVGVFNGFGSKGNVFIPWLAEKFAEYLTTGTALPEDCDFSRRPPRRKQQ